MDSDFQQQQYQHHFQDLQKQFQHQKQQVNSLTRFRSAPSSYFASFLDAADTVTNPGGGANGGDRGDHSNAKGDFFNARPLSPETENILSKFVSSMDDGNNSLSQNLCEIPKNSQIGPQFTAKVKQEGDYNTSSPMIYHSTSKPPLANQHSSASAASSVRMHSKPHMKIGIGGRDTNTTSSLTRHSSSPAGFFDNLNIDGYGVISGMGNYGSGNTSNDQVNYSSGQPSTTPGLMRQNSQVEEKIMRMNSLEETNFSNPISSWADSILSETIPSLDGDDDRKIFSEQNLSDNQTGESRGRTPQLAHHLSLPSTSAELSAMEKLLYLQDAVPLRIRAKRGFATHPRSIAERVRRTKISERMRKLQDLVPNMDKVSHLFPKIALDLEELLKKAGTVFLSIWNNKSTSFVALQQTNTADMLELAVDYIKDLRKQVKTLHGNQAKCTCPR